MPHWERREANGRRRSVGYWEGQLFAFQLSSDGVQAVVDESQAVLQARDNDAFNAGKRRGTPLRSVDAAVVACRCQAANVTFAAVVIRRHARVSKESEQFVAMLEEPLPDALAFAVTGAAVQE